MPGRFRKKARKVYKKKVPKIIKNYVKKTIDRNVEDKYFQIPSSTAIIVPNSNSSLNASIHLTGVTRGTQRNQRVGNKIRIKSIRLDTIWFTYSNTGAITNFTVFGTQPSFRYALIQQKIPGDIAPCATPSNIGFDGDQNNAIWLSGALGDVTTNQRLIPGVPNYVVLKTGKFHLQTMLGGGDTSPLALPQYKVKTIMKRFRKPVTVSFSDAQTGNSADVVKNSLWLVMMSDAGTAEQYTNAAMRIGWTLQYEDA